MMFRQIFTLAFAILYFLISTGFSVDVHSCQGTVKSVKVLAEIGDNCCNNPEAPKDCCSEESDFILFETYRSYTESSISNDLDKSVPDALFAGQLSDIQAQEDLPEFQHCTLDIPQPGPLRILHCSLLYYG